MNGGPPDDLTVDMTGEVAVVTGGTRGIGRAVAERFAAAGATTVATYHADEDAAADTERALAEAAADAGADAATAVRKFDVGDGDAVDAAFRALREAHGPPTVLVNNAGVMQNGPLVRMSDDQWAEVIRTNLTGAFYCTRAALRGMLAGDGGAIVNVASVAAERGWAGQANYAASKAGLLGLTRSAAREYGSRGVRVNAVCPGYVDTGVYDDLAESGDDPESEVTDLERVPQGRAADPGEVANSVLYLASDAADYVNGSVLRVDGGRLA